MAEFETKNRTEKAHHSLLTLWEILAAGPAPLLRSSLIVELS